MLRLIAAAVLAVVIAASPAAALEVRVKDVRTGSSVLHAGIELREVIPDRFKRALEENTPLHLQLQAELWESRPVWDRLVYPAIVRVIRMTRDMLPPDPMPVTLDLGDASRIVASGRYYVHVMATIGTLAERDADEVGDAVFGRESETNTLGSLGRLVFRTALQIGNYLQSVTAETRSKRMSGGDLLKP
jgi:hypothetical protein